MSHQELSQRLATVITHVGKSGRPLLWFRGPGVGIQLPVGGDEDARLLATSFCVSVLHLGEGVGVSRICELQGWGGGTHLLGVKCGWSIR